MLLENPTDAASLASMIFKLYGNLGRCARLGAKASETARQFLASQNATDVGASFEEITRRKSELRAQALTQES